MKRNDPLVSVIMPAYNAEKYVGFAIQSILEQTYKDLELIVINDCSTDDTKSVIQTYLEKDERVRLIDNPHNMKIARSLNRGIESSKGKYIARMDADDWSYPYRIEKQVELMENDPEIVLCSGNMEICDKDMVVKSKSNMPQEHEKIMKVILQYNPMVSPAMMWKKETSLEVNGFMEDTITEDYMFVLDMSTKGLLINLNDTLIKYRIIKSSMTSTKNMGSHLSSLDVTLKGFLKYKYELSLKTKIIMVLRLLIAFMIPATFWRIISSRLRA